MEPCRILPSDISERVEALKPWFHTIDLGGGQRIERDPVYGSERTYPEPLWKIVSQLLPVTVAGCRVLDVGCNAGYFSIEMKRAGAAYVLGLEGVSNFVDQARLVREILGIDIDFRRLNVYDIREDLGQFDITLFLGVLYHLKHPLYALENLAKVTKGFLVIESAILPEAAPTASVFDYGGPMHQLGFVENKAGTEAFQNWSIPSLSTLKAFLGVVGFKKIVREFVLGERATLVAERPA